MTKREAIIEMRWAAERLRRQGRAMPKTLNSGFFSAALKLEEGALYLNHGPFQPWPYTQIYMMDNGHKVVIKQTPPLPEDAVGVGG